jgi:hypothetical protein
MITPHSGARAPLRPEMGFSSSSGSIISMTHCAGPANWSKHWSSSLVLILQPELWSSRFAIRMVITSWLALSMCPDISLQQAVMDNVHTSALYRSPAGLGR